MCAVALGTAPLGAENPPAPVLSTEKDKASYSLGVNMGRDFRRQEIVFDLDLLIKGLKDGHSGQKLLITEKELHAVLNRIQAETRRKAGQFRGKPAENNKRRGEEFLAENQKKPGVVVLPSGLQYKVLQAGSGRKPSATDTVQCQYRITHLDGKEIFATGSKKPADFQVKKTIVPGFAEVLPLMAVGAKWQLFLPPQLGYGEMGVGRTIEPNETLIAELELLEVK